MSHDSKLEPILRAVEPAVRLVPERHLRQVLYYLIDAGVSLPSNPNLPLRVSRDALLAAEVLPAHVLEGAEPELLLVTAPDDRLIDHLPGEQQLRAYWRVLFQAAVMREIDRKVQAGTLTAEECRQRLARFGPAAAREIRYVLDAEHLVGREADGVAQYRAFAASYLDLAAFAGHSTEDYFPSLPHGDAVLRALGKDVDAPALQAATRPAGAADPYREPEPDERWTAADTLNAPPPTPPTEPGVLARALQAEQAGNNVRAAILRTQAAVTLIGEDREFALGGARTALGRLVDALGDIFGWDTDTRQEWRQSLAPLLQPAAAGIWPRAARCLYELQKIPAELSREVYAVDLPEVIRTFGRRPMKRPLPLAKPVLILMGLKRAYAQMLRAGLGHAAQLRLDRLFHHQIHECEHAIRHDFTPVIVTALTQAGLVPTNTVEEVARDKLVAELLDRVCDRGYLRIGDLRDAIARNRLKIGDLAGLGEFLRGDALLRADINLSYALDGVYRKGEFYLRWLQRFSALFFGTKLGRLFTLFIAVPFGGAFLTLMFAEEMKHIGGKVIALVVKPAPKPFLQPQQTQPGTPSEAPDLIEADEVDVDENGEIIVHEVDPGTITSERVWLDAQGEIIWNDPTEQIEIVKQVITATPLTKAEAEAHTTILSEWPVIVGFGVFLLLMFHVPPFRRAVFWALTHLWWAVRAVLWDIPMQVWRSRAARGFRQSRPVRLFVRYFWSPLLITLIVCAVLYLTGRLVFGFQRGFLLWFLLRWGLASWAALTLAYITPWGWMVQDRIAEAVSDWWRVVRVNLIPGLLRSIIDAFAWLANKFEGLLYAVDERLRYRSGDTQSSLAIKAILGLVWFPIAYISRFAFNLLIEPQINPIKHFPVVTVSHKMLLPLVVSKAPAAELSMFGEVIAAHTGWSVAKSNIWAFWIIAGVPGIFGFMAWEFLANWRLYRANRPAKLRPVMLGSHGESMRGLLRPGFHSGTIPRVFKKMRHADRARGTRLHHDLEHAAEAIHRFAERELIHLLARSPDWGGVRLHVEGVRFGCQRLTLELTARSLGRDVFALSFENVGGRIEATIDQVGWADKLTEPQRAAFVAGLRGFLDMAAAERIDGRERVEAPAPLGPGFADLARRVSWAEWVERWHAPNTGGAA